MAHAWQVEGPGFNSWYQKEKTKQKQSHTHTDTQNLVTSCISFHLMHNLKGFQIAHVETQEYEVMYH